MSDSYKYKQYGVDDTSNTCANPALSEVLGVQVKLEEREHRVGNFALDLKGRVVGSDQIVIVENQYFGPSR